MTQVSPAPSIQGPASIRQIPAGNGGAQAVSAGFSLTLTAPERPRVAVPRPAAEAAEAEAEARHVIAGTGKDLPVGEMLADSGDESADAEAPFAWFAVALPAPVPEAAPAIAVVPQPVAAVELPKGEAASLPQTALPETALPQPALPQPALPGTALSETAQPEAPAVRAAAQPAGFALENGPAHPAAAEPIPVEIAKIIASLDSSLAAPVDIAPDAPVRRVQGIEISRSGRIDGSARIELPAHSPILATLAALQPRAQANPLAAMLAPAGFELAEPLRRPASEPVLAMLTPVNGLEMQRAGVVQAVADVQQAIIDTRKSDWMSSTIERIEALRDSPNSRETSLRLSPDALGKVDVSIRQEGDKIHVRFAAETAAARTLLTEAQSRLNDIAEARGLKLGGTTVDAGTAGQGQRHEAAPRTDKRSAPASALTGETQTTSDAHDHGRVA